MEIIDVWIRTRKPDGTYEGHYEKFNASEFDGAVFSGSPESPQITLKNGHVFDIYTRYDGGFGYGEEIDHGDPVLIKKISDENEARLKVYYQQHPDEDPANLPLHQNCRCYSPNLQPPHTNTGY